MPHLGLVIPHSVHAAPGDGDPLVGMIVIVGGIALGIAALLLVHFINRGSDSGSGSDGGPGGGPRPDPGPGPGDAPAWWPEFERQFAEHVRLQARTRRPRPLVRA